MFLGLGRCPLACRFPQGPRSWMDALVDMACSRILLILDCPTLSLRDTSRNKRHVLQVAVGVWRPPGVQHSKLVTFPNNHWVNDMP